MSGTHGSRTWFFPDGDIPAPGDSAPFGHESLIILNPNDKDAEVVITVYFEQREPEVLASQLVGARRVHCLRRPPRPAPRSAWTSPFFTMSTTSFAVVRSVRRAASPAGLRRTVFSPRHSRTAYWFPLSLGTWVTVKVTALKWRPTGNRPPTGD